MLEPSGAGRFFLVVAPMLIVAGGGEDDGRTAPPMIAAPPTYVVAEGPTYAPDAQGEVCCTTTTSPGLTLTAQPSL